MLLDNINAVIFDLDGTLIDSMWIWDKIDEDYLKEKGFDIPHNLRVDIAHLSFDETAIYFKTRFSLNDSLDQIKNRWLDMAIGHYSNTIPLKPGAKEFLHKLKSKGIQVAIATSNTHCLIEPVLKNNGIYDYFHSITTTSEAGKGKEYPDVYLLAAKKLSVNPENCLVFEDILPAVLAAKAAGMRVIGVQDLSAEDQWTHISKHAEIFIQDFTELNKSI